MAGHPDITTLSINLKRGLPDGGMARRTVRLTESLWYCGMKFKLATAVVNLNGNNGHYVSFVWDARGFYVYDDAQCFHCRTKATPDLLDSNTVIANYELVGTCAAALTSPSAERVWESLGEAAMGGVRAVCSELKQSTDAL